MTTETSEVIPPQTVRRSDVSTSKRGTLISHKILLHETLIYV